MSIKGNISFISVLSVLLVLAFPAASWTSCAFGQGEQKFMAALSGQEVVPPLTVQQGAFGIAEFTAMGNNITYFINATGYGNNDTGGYIRSGMPGEEGPVLVELWQTGSPMNRNGTVTAEELTGPLSGSQLTDLVAAMSNGTTYVNIHTEPHTNGEIRGQIGSSSNGVAILR